MARKEDSRAIHSKDKIRQAFLELLKTKGFEKTTVSDIIKLANVNRSTFYAHYIDKFDLLDKFEDNMFREITYASGVIPEDIFQNDFIHNGGFHKYITCLLTIISQNKEIFTIIYNSGQTANFQKKLFDYMNEIWSVHHINESLKISADYVQIATVGMLWLLIEKWIENGCDKDISEFSVIVSDIVSTFIEGVLNR